MAETEEETKTTEEAVAPAAPGVVYYLVRSVTRGRSNRTARATQTGRRGFVQRFAGGTILVRRARPARIPEAVLKANIEEIKKSVAEHRVEVTTLMGQLVNLDTFEIGPLAATRPLPNPPLDSAKNDKNQGIGYDVPPNPTGTPQDAPLPELLRRDGFQEPEPEEEHPKPLPERSRSVLEGLLQEEVEPASSEGDRIDVDVEPDSEVEPEPETTPTPPTQESSPTSSPGHRTQGKGKRGRQ